MSRGNFSAFLESLAAFESGIDLNQQHTQQSLQWLGVFDPERGGVDPSTVDFSDPNDIANLQYHVHNTLGFLGKYQFGEPLLIDLGYYIPADSGYYGTTATNQWQGTWTGKNGVFSKEDFMTDVQEIVIRDAFQFNLDIIQTQLANAGKTIDDFVGDSFTYTRNGETHEAEVSLSGILASAHLQGPYGLSNLLLNGTVSYDEYGTNILFYMDRFGDYDTPYADDYLGQPIADNDTQDPAVDPGADNDSPVQQPVVDYAFTWNWGSNEVINEFNPAEDVIDLSKFWTDYSSFQVYDNAEGNAVIDLTQLNNQTITLVGVATDQLNAINIMGVEGDFDSALVDTALEQPTSEDVPVDKAEGENYFYTWAWGSNDTVSNFNVFEDKLDLSSFWTAYDEFSIYDDNQSNAVIDLTDLNNQTIKLLGVNSGELSEANFIGVNGNYSQLQAPEPNDLFDQPSSVEEPVVQYGNGSTVYGTEGADSFAYTWQWGESNIIENFDPDYDVVDLHAFWTTSANVDLYNNADGDAVIDLTELNNQTITIKGVGVERLNEDDIIY